ncbi:MAG: hypothetical protein AAFQ83_22195 [Bacteroidota bacterium]
MKLHISFLLLLSLLIVACKQTPEQTDTPPPTVSTSPTETPSPSPTPDSKEKVATILTDYYDALAAEDLAIGDFYADQVLQFYKAENYSRAQVVSSLQQSFNSVENRSIQLNMESLKVTETQDQIATMFQGTTSFTDSKTQEIKNAAFATKIVFNSDLKIISYQNLPVPAATDPTQKVGETPAVPEGLLAVVKGACAALEAGNLDDFMKFVPSTGGYIIVKPGVAPIPNPFANATELGQSRESFIKGTRNFCQDMQIGPAPSFDCYDFFSDSGCFLQKLETPYEDLTELMKALNEAEMARYETTPFEQAQNFQQNVSYQLIDTDELLSMYFGQIEGKWYCLVLDYGSFDCSA